MIGYRARVYETLKKDHRWGETEELWNLEADTFFNVERPHYRDEAIKYGYPVFETADDAFEIALSLLK